jgi:hypothetical protein
MKNWNSYKKSQTGKRKAIITRAESRTGRKKQEEQSDRQHEMLEFLEELDRRKIS